jgi:hypothetical protein
METEPPARFLARNPPYRAIRKQMIATYSNQEWYDALKHHLDAQTLVEILHMYPHFVTDRIFDIPTEPLIRDWQNMGYRRHVLRVLQHYLALTGRCSEAVWKRCMHALINNDTDRLKYIIATYYCPQPMLIPLFSILQEHGIKQVHEELMRDLHDRILSSGTALDIQVWFRQYCSHDWFRRAYIAECIRDPIFHVLGSDRSLEDMSIVLNIVYTYINCAMGTYPVRSMLIYWHHINRLKLLSYWIPRVSYEITMDVQKHLTNKPRGNFLDEQASTYDRQHIQHSIDEIRQHRDGIGRCLNHHMLKELVPLVEYYLG